MTSSWREKSHYSTCLFCFIAKKSTIPFEKLKSRQFRVPPQNCFWCRKKVTIIKPRRRRGYAGCQNNKFIALHTHQVKLSVKPSKEAWCAKKDTADFRHHLHRHSLLKSQNSKGQKWSINSSHCYSNDLANLYLIYDWRHVEATNKVY